MRKIGLLLLFVLVAAAAGIVGWRANHTETALEGLQSALAQSTPEWGMNKVIAEEPLGERDTLVFYETDDGTVIVARMTEEKTLWSVDWKLDGAIGAGATTKPQDATLLFAKSARGDEKETIVNGALYSDLIESVTVDDQPAKIIGEKGKTRVYYYVIPGAMDGQKGWVKAYDKQGKLLEEMR